MSPDDPTKTYQYHLEHYGPEFLYDDFIANFTAENFRPKEWVDLIADAGARYLVPTTKHHDGYALFDMPETISKRNSVKQLPHRDFLKVCILCQRSHDREIILRERQELFDAAKKYQPHLRRGTYFSMPEWFNPAYSNYTWLNAFGIGKETYLALPARNKSNATLQDHPRTHTSTKLSHTQALWK